MKRIINQSIALLIVLTSIFCLASCKNNSATGLWQNAIYTEDQTLGNGAKTCVVEVKAEEKSVVFTLKTDKTYVGEALVENELIEGEEGAYGLYVKAVNGIIADYDVDASYWAFNIDGEYALTGVDQTEIKEGVNYQLVYTK